MVAIMIEANAKLQVSPALWLRALDDRQWVCMRMRMHARACGMRARVPGLCVRVCVRACVQFVCARVRARVLVQTEMVDVRKCVATETKVRRPLDCFASVRACADVPIYVPPRTPAHGRTHTRHNTTVH